MKQKTPSPAQKIFEVIVAPSPALRLLGEPARRFQILACSEAEAHSKALASYARSVPKQFQHLAR
jgi:hypothetical protein